MCSTRPLVTLGPGGLTRMTHNKTPTPPPPLQDALDATRFNMGDTNKGKEKKVFRDGFYNGAPHPYVILTCAW